MKHNIPVNLVKETTVLMVLAICTAVIFNHFSPAGIALVGQWDPSLGVISARPEKGVVLPEREIRDIALAKAIYDARQALFVDVRHPPAFDEGHIKGARSLPVSEMDNWIDSFIEHYPVSHFIVVYCQGRECDASHRAAQFLTDMGYEQVKVFIDGYAGWEAAGFPIESEKRK